MRKSIKKSAKRAATKRATKNAARNGNHRGRVSALEGKKLFLTKAVLKSNPRRTGTWGFRSLEIIRKKNGITYNDAVAKGARGVDIRWDIKYHRINPR